MTNSHIHLYNSDKVIFAVSNETKKYLQQHTTFAEKTRDCLEALRTLSNLQPLTIEKVGSGYLFPIIEAEYELESSIVFCKLGFYKHAISSIRNILELGLLSVYWDIDDNVHSTIKAWVFSTQDTPFQKEIRKKLVSNNNINKFNAKHKILNKLKVLYDELCNFSHTKVQIYSSRKLTQ